ncbi:MAG: hypothetical protein CMH54_01660 [Myxococcales bacterium]|nr:hypothetical protein [Myxococcales bacterium]
MDTTNHEINTQIKQIRERLSETIDRIRNVLQNDLSAFPLREGKRCFVASGDGASHLDDDKLRAMKQELKSVATIHADAIMAKLEDETLWLQLDLEIPNPVPKTLLLNVPLMTVLEEIARQTRAVLQAHGFPDDVLNFSYKTPTWFIDHEYMPGLIEQYWGLLTALKTANSDALQQQVDQDTDARKQRWDDT